MHESIFVDIPKIQQGIPRPKDYIELASSSFFRSIERYSDMFIQELRQNSPQDLENWPWPLDSLHSWSRQWEYPFCLSSLMKWQQKWVSQGNPKVLDAGTGLTFMPSFLKQLDWDVSCGDSDSRLPSVFKQLGIDRVCDFKLLDLASMDFGDATFDAVICISVLEHLKNDDQEKALSEFRRVLRQGGVLILTFDIALDGKDDLSISKAAALINHLSQIFQSELGYIIKELNLLSESPDQFVTTTWVKEHWPDLLPWKVSTRHLLKSLLKLQPSKRPFRPLSFCCLTLQKG